MMNQKLKLAVEVAKSVACLAAAGLLVNMTIDKMTNARLLYMYLPKK